MLTPSLPLDFHPIDDEMDATSEVREPTPWIPIGMILISFQSFDIYVHTEF